MQDKDAVAERMAAMPDLAERRVLVALTHEPQTDVLSKGEAAVEGNSRIPFAQGKVLSAAPFSVVRADDTDRKKAELCMTQAIYYEAGFEPLEGKRAVAQTVLNRVRHPAFPHSVCGVVYEGARQPVCQFSFTCDGALARKPTPGAWAEARAVARAALDGYVDKSVGTATHYHANYVLPRWASELAKITRIGAHIFYRWPGGWGLPRAFSQHYTGVEIVPLFDGAIAGNNGLAIDYPPIAALPERRADNDLGGRVDVSKGWTPHIPAPTQSSSALARIYAAQSVNVAGVSQ
ncbi:MAG: cell wall hydrolase [Alphaproteobacteria bacterium]|nr:cell wall hydrolase [Alphaproteobacteria bacterium]